MRLRRFAGLATAVAVGFTAGVPVCAAAADTTTLYVDGSMTSFCSDGGSGTQAVPFCSIQAAADVVQAGQTVQIAPGQYQAPVVLRRSGAAGHPITFAGHGYVDIMQSVGDGSTPALGLNGVHDVVISGITIEAANIAVGITDSSAVTLEGISFSAGLSNSRPVYPQVTLTGATSSVTVQQNDFMGGAGDFVAVGAGVKDTLVTANVFHHGGAAVVATDAPGTRITNNTTLKTCGHGIVLAGASTGSVVENNILGSVETSAYPCTAGPSPAAIEVSAGSAVGSTYDYNLVQPSPGVDSYQWGGQSYQTPAALAAASGQGAHDLAADPQFVSSGGVAFELKPTSPAVDSGDSAAPGIGADRLGRPITDDPQVANAGTGAGTRDRGALELQSFSGLSLSASSAAGVTPLKVTFTAGMRANWPSDLSYRFDFHDGSAPVVTSSPTVDHVFTTDGNSAPTVTVTDPGGFSASASTAVSHAAAPQPQVAITPVVGKVIGWPEPVLTYRFNTADSYGPWPLVSASIDFGDGSAPASIAPGYNTTHTYSTTGPRTVALTETDSHGGSTTISRQVDVAYQPGGFVPLTPVRVLDTRGMSLPGSARGLGPGQNQRLQLGWYRNGTVEPGGDQIPPGATAVILNVTAVNPTSGGHLDLWPTSQGPSHTSNVNFVAAQTIPNLVTVPVDPDGSVSIHNNSGNVDVVVDLFGYYRPGTGSGFTSTAPTRLLDTRAGGDAGRLGSGGETSVQVAGVGGVPATATAAVLNLTATEPTHDGFLTAYASGTPRPGTSNLNFTAGETIPNQVVVPIGADGKVTLFNRIGATHVVADLFGYYSPSGGDFFTPTNPARMLDTRDGAGLKLGTDSMLSVAVSGTNGVPTGATAAVMNVTVTGPDQSSFLAVYPDGISRPATSNLNFRPGNVLSNHVTTPLAANGRIDIYNHSGSTHVVADLFGYFSRE